MLRNGQVLEGRYRVLRKLGEGGMGAVYQVEHIHLKTNFALKVLLNLHPAVRSRFLNEARIMAGLRHSHIASVSDLVADRVAGIVMEYVEGPTLDDWVDERGPQTPESCRRVLSPMLDAVGFAHSHGIVHRDLKPANVLVGSTAHGLRPVVLDFGIAKVRTEASLGSKQKTAYGDVLGTPGYMAPEQIRNSSEVDERSDVYALGLLLYELATGAVAFDQETPWDMARAIVTGQPKPLPPTVDSTVGDCITRAMAVKPKDRFENCGDFSRALGGAAQVAPPGPQDWDRLLDVYNRLITRSRHVETVVEAYLEKARLLDRSLGRSDQAADHLRKALALSGGHVEATVRLAEIQLRLGQWADAASLADRMLEHSSSGRTGLRNEDLAALLLIKALALEGTGDAAGAANWLREASRRAPASLGSWSSAGGARKALRRYVEREV